MAKFQVNRINPRIEILKGAIDPNTTETWSTNYFKPLVNMKLNTEEVLNLIFKDFKEVTDGEFRYDLSILNNTEEQRIDYLFNKKKKHISSTRIKDLRSRS